MNGVPAPSFVRAAVWVLGLLAGFGTSVAACYKCQPGQPVRPPLGVYTVTDSSVAELEGASVVVTGQFVEISYEVDSAEGDEVYQVDVVYEVLPNDVPDE